MDRLRCLPLLHRFGCYPVRAVKEQINGAPSIFGGAAPR
jgi:hypothetical protein